MRSAFPARRSEGRRCRADRGSEKPGQPPKSAELPLAEGSQEPVHTELESPQTMSSKGALGFCTRPSRSRAAPTRRGHSHWSREPGSAEREVGKVSPCVPAGVCWRLRLFLSSVPLGKEGPWAAEVAYAVTAALRPGQPPGRAPVPHREGPFPRMMLYCSSGSFLHPLSPSSDLTFPRLLSPPSPEPLLWSCPHSCPRLICSTHPAPSLSPKSCCLPHSPRPPLPGCPAAWTSGNLPT